MIVFKKGIKSHINLYPYFYIKSSNFEGINLLKLNHHAYTNTSSIFILVILPVSNPHITRSVEYTNFT